MLLSAACGNKLDDIAKVAGGEQAGNNVTVPGGQSGYFRAEDPETAQVLPAAKIPDMPFELKKEMLFYDYTDRVIQVYDLILDYSGKYTVSEILDQVESSALEFTVESLTAIRHGDGYDARGQAYVPDEWLGAGNSTQLRLHPKHEQACPIRLFCANPTDEVIELKDAVVYWIKPEEVSVTDDEKWFPENPYIWYPPCIRIVCDGLTYDNIPELFPQYEVVEYETNIGYNNDGLFWNASQMEYKFSKHVEDVDWYDGSTGSLSFYISFKIDSKTKAVRYYYISWSNGLDGYSYNLNIE